VTEHATAVIWPPQPDHRQYRQDALTAGDLVTFGQERSAERPVLTIAQIFALADAIDQR
jgi:hypothetical protein